MLLTVHTAQNTSRTIDQFRRNLYNLFFLVTFQGQKTKKTKREKKKGKCSLLWLCLVLQQTKLKYNFPFVRLKSFAYMHSVRRRRQGGKVQVDSMIRFVACLRGWMRTRSCIKRIEEREDAVSNTTTTKVCTGNRPTTAGTVILWGSDKRGGKERTMVWRGGVVLQQRRKHQAAYGSKSKSGRR